MKRYGHRKKAGRGLLGTIGSVASAALNKGIDLLPVELHLPNYNYCGPGTKLATRLARGDRGINQLDDACKQHDIAYSRFSDTENRRIADRILADKAWARVKSSDASIPERAAAWSVATGMNLKSKLGGSVKKRRTILR